jgi:hypothetical protein
MLVDLGWHAGNEGGEATHRQSEGSSHGGRHGIRGETFWLVSAYVKAADE